MLNRLTEIAKEIFVHRYPDADVIFLAGSLVRGEGTPYSDLDLVVIFDRLPNAYRESFRFGGFPVEAFVHDPQTLNYFFYELDRPSGIPSLPQMVLDGIEVPAQNELSQRLKQLAASLLADGPPRLSEEDIRKLRYGLTDLIDDIRQPRSREELVASGAKLYQALADYYLRANNLWSASGKSIPRALSKADAALALRFQHGFEELFCNGQPAEIIALTEEILAPNGGFLFEGHRLESPANWRR